MNRIQAVKLILKKIKKDEILIITTGYLSRDVCMVKDRPLNFYMAGSMGYAYSIGLGLALNSKRKVTVISGDGAALMNLGSLVLGDYLRLKNLTHYIIDNESYASTGGQKTCSRSCNFSQFYKTYHIKIKDDGIPSPRLPFNGKFIKERFLKGVIQYAS